MRVPSDLVETLVAVLDEGSLDAAARRLHVTPSAISQRIRALERIAGRVLLVRSKPVRATEAAHPFVRYARQLALLERDALAELDGATATVPLAVNADSLATWFLPPLSRLSAAHDVVFDLHRDDQDFTAGLLESGTVMGAVTSRETPVAGCRVSPLGALRYEAVAAPGFARRWFGDAVTQTDAAALEAAPVVDFDRRDELQTRWLRSRSVDPARAPRHRVPASQDFAAAVLLGLGWALLPTLQSSMPVDRGELVRLGGADVVVPLFWQQWNVRSPLLDAVADEIVAEARKVLG
ncbi:LysR family transcriptional regulator ArgP [Microbacterium radiodurans]|uniref:LysR family transcriptional regulator ArgP n=1 Tax=Microbacterium radiodurans TaxID=661398 RepID=A0A5J5IV73_9MICO|nr:LysR family transcriptional regulator ArgP [Microbacterium radiodurans]KAA9089883.1 LysR family transcriptional regulator ArgP [Microbacterium radiodurans]